MLRGVAALLLAAAVAAAALRLFEQAARIPEPAAGERDTVVAGVRWRSREVPGRGPWTVVFVHGFLSSSWTWQRALPAASGGRRGLAIDLPGSGYSDRPWPYDYTVPAQAVHLLEYLEARKIGPVVLVGNSLGGAVCLLAASLHPERVAALVLVDSASPRTSMPPGFRGLRTPALGELQIQLLSRPVMEFTLRRRLYARADRVREETVDSWWRPVTVPGTRRAALAAIRTRSEGYEGLLPGIRTPTLILWGREDHLLPLSDGVEISRSIPGSLLSVLPDAGHLPQEEAPESFSRAVARFLDEVEARGKSGAPRTTDDVAANARTRPRTTILAAHRAEGPGP